LTIFGHLFTYAHIKFTEVFATMLIRDVWIETKRNRKGKLTFKVKLRQEAIWGLLKRFGCMYKGDAVDFPARDKVRDWSWKKKMVIIPMKLPPFIDYANEHPPTETAKGFADWYLDACTNLKRTRTDKSLNVRFTGWKWFGKRLVMATHT
jgi:hypothetical protein